MRRKLQPKWVLLVIGLGAALLLVGIPNLNRPADPIYKGKPLSIYLTSLATKNASLRYGYTWVWWEAGEPTELERPTADCSFADGEALHAISAVGTNAFEMLLHMMRPEPELDFRLRRLAERFPRLHNWVRLKPQPYYFSRQLAAVAAFQELGPRAAPVVPRLIRLLRDPNTAPPALVALSAIRPESERGIVKLTNCFEIQSQGQYGTDPTYLHGCCLLTLSTFGRKAFDAVPFLVQKLQSTNDWVQSCSAVALARIGAPPDQVVPILIGNLNTNLPALGPGAPSPAQIEASSYRIQHLQINVWALGQFGSRATSALPILNALQSYPNDKVAVTAWHAANKITAGSPRLHDEG